MSKSSHDFNGTAARIRAAVDQADQQAGISLGDICRQIGATTRRERANVAHQCNKMWRYGILQRLQGEQPYRYTSGRAPHPWAQLSPEQRRAKRREQGNAWYTQTRARTQPEFDALMQRLQAQGINIRQAILQAIGSQSMTATQIYTALGLSTSCGHVYSQQTLLMMAEKGHLIRTGSGESRQFRLGPVPYLTPEEARQQAEAARAARLEAYRAEVAKRAADRARARQAKRERKAAEDAARRQRLHALRAERQAAKQAAARVAKQQRAAQQAAERAERQNASATAAAERARQRAEAAKAKAQAKQAAAEARQREYERRKQAALEREQQKAKARGNALRKAISRLNLQSTANAAPADETPAETLEQFLARGGQVEVLPHKFDEPRPALGRRPGMPSNF